MKILILFALLAVGAIFTVEGGSKKKPHGHTGVLEVYSGKPIPMKLTKDQSKKLEKGEAVSYNERDGKSGRGVVIQDVNATESVCMGKIRDLSNYNKMVPHVKKCEIYKNEKFFNGTSKTACEFNIGLMGMGFTYYLLLTHSPKYGTVTWTLDYNHNSDFDDNVGHWQVMPHPSKRGWTRILYSTKIKLFNWIPEFIISFLTGKALTESTGWVKKYSEEEMMKINNNNNKASMPSWLNLKGGGSAFTSMNDKMKEMEDHMTNQRRKMMGSLRALKPTFKTK